MQTMVPDDCSLYPSECFTWDDDELEAQRRRAAWLQEALRRAIDSGKAMFRVPPGNYRFPGKEGLLLEHAADIRIEAEGAVFWFPRGSCGVHFRHCRHVRLSGLCCDLDSMPFLQGSIEAVDLKALRLKVRLDHESAKRYPSTSAVKRFRIMFLDETGSRETDNIDFRPETEKINFDGIDLLDIPVYDHVAAHWKLQMRPPCIGDRIVLGMRQEGGMILSESCAEMEFSDITVWAAAGFAFAENGHGSGGNRYCRCRLVRRPDTGRLIAGAADCFHSLNQRKGPLIEDCEFSWAMDDLVNIHGFFHVVVDVLSSDEVILAAPFGTQLEKDAMLRFYDPPYGTPGMESRVLSTAPWNEAPDDWELRIIRHYRTKFGIELRDFSKSVPCRVRLDRPVTAKAFDIAGTYCACGANAVLHGNHLHDGHVRGILLKSRDCVIENNLIERIALNGIILKPELYWLEGPMPENIQITGNTLIDCAFDYTGLAAIAAMCGFCPPPSDRLTAVINMCGINVCGNTVRRCRSGPGILLANGTHLTVRGNHLTQLYANPLVSWAENITSRLDVPPNAADTAEFQRGGICFISCENFSCEKNEVGESSPEYIRI